MKEMYLVYKGMLDPIISSALLIIQKYPVNTTYNLIVYD